MICRNCTTGQATASSSTRDLRPRARRQLRPAEIRRWRRRSVQMGRKIFERLSSSNPVDRCNPWRDISCGGVAAPRETLNGRQCGSIGKQLRVDAETPMQKRQCRNANAATPPWNATAQKQCAALGFVCPTLRKKLSKRASELASKLPSMQPASELAS